MRQATAHLATALWLLASAARGGGLTVGRGADVTSEVGQADQRRPAVAFGGGVYLVVWQEGEAVAGAMDTHILAARVSPDGRPLDSKPLTVCSAIGFQIYPAVAFDGRSFLIAWQDYRGGRDWDLFAARVSPEGKVLDADGFALAAGPGNQVHPAAASNGRRCLVVWSDLRPRDDGREGYGLYGTFVSDGRAADQAGRELAPHLEPRSGRVRNILAPVAGWDGREFVVAAQTHPSGWTHGGPLLLRVAPDGKAEPRAESFLGECFTLAADPAGGRTLLWSNCKTEHGHGQTRYLLSLLTQDGQAHHMVLGLQRAFSPVNELWCAAAWDGRGFVAAVEQCPNYVDSREGRHGPVEVDIVATRVDGRTGRPLDTGWQEVPAKACQDPRPYGKDEALLAKATGGVRAAAESGIRERHPAMASSGDGRSLLVYSRHAWPGDYRLRCVLLTQGS